MKLIVKIPTESVSKIIGPSGSIIKQLQGISETKIKLKTEDQEFSICYIHGPKENAELAEKLILDIIANKSPLTKSKKEYEIIEKEDTRYERLTETMDDNMIQVYVSSIANPAHFWLQLITPKACALEHLVDGMSEFYSIEENRKAYALTKVTVGQIIATKLPTDEKWCRAEVCGIKGKVKDQNPETMIDLFCVDYGDSSYQSLKHIFQIRTDFLSLRFQAIEATMSNIVPKHGHEWSEESTTAFENMVFTGEWKVMMAQVDELKKKIKNTKKGYSVPAVRLYDPENPQGMDISQKLISMGHAAPAFKNDLSARTQKEEKKENKRKKGAVVKQTDQNEKIHSDLKKENGLANAVEKEECKSHKKLASGRSKQKKERS